MGRVLVGFIGLALVLSAASSARSDIPLPPNLKYVDPIVRFDGVDQLSDYVFHLRFTTFSGAPTNEYRYLPVSEGKPFNLQAQRRLTGLQLLGLKRDEFASREKEDPSLKWLTAETPNVLVAEVPTPSTTGLIDKPVPVTGYRVLMREGKLVVEAGPAGKKLGTVPPVSTWVSGVALALAVTALGFQTLRSRSRLPPAQEG